MLGAKTLVALAATAAVDAAYTGFNYGSNLPSGAVKVQADYEAEFEAAANLAGTNGQFTSARLYTMIQGNTNNEPIEAIPAAIKTDTSLLLGLWASAGEAAFNNELDALRKAVERYGNDVKIAGISVGSEDLYRISVTGIENSDGLPGTAPDVLADYIKKARDVISGTPWESAPVGHVDTWTAFVNGSNKAVIDACDFLGMDAYAYFEGTKNNIISNGKQLFDEAWEATKAFAQGKPVWITETGWPVSGKTTGKGVPSPENAETFWKDVGCPMFGEENVWWYTFQDSDTASTPNPSFGVIGGELTTEPLYDLSCSGADSGDDDNDDTPTSSDKTSTSAPTSTKSESTAAPTGGDDGEDDGQDDGQDDGEDNGDDDGEDNGDDNGDGNGSATTPPYPTTTFTSSTHATSTGGMVPTTSGGPSVPTGAADSLSVERFAAAAAVVAAALAL